MVEPGQTALALADVASRAYDGPPLVDVLVACCGGWAWLWHGAFVAALRRRVCRSLRGPLPALAAWTLTVPTTLVRFKVRFRGGVLCFFCFFLFRWHSFSFFFVPKASLVGGGPVAVDAARAALQLLYLATLLPQAPAAGAVDLDSTFRSLAEESESLRLDYQSVLRNYLPSVP